MLEIVDIVKKYEEFQLGPINMELNAKKTASSDKAAQPGNSEGTIVGLVGPNGAGKSTLFKAITGSYDLDQGRIKVHQQIMTPENFELKRKLGYLPQNLSLPRWATPKELAHYAATLLGIPHQEASKELLYWDCVDYIDRPIAQCSHGMAKRVGLTVSLIHQPALCILDEPFTGLDLTHIQSLFDRLQQRKKQGLVTILSTHIAPYVSRLCDELYTIENGKMSYIDRWPTLTQHEKEQEIEDIFIKIRNHRKNKETDKKTDKEPGMDTHKTAPETETHT